MITPAEERLIKNFPYPVEQKTLPLNNGFVRLLLTGNTKEKRVFIFIHGLNMGWGMWYKIIPQLSSYGRCILIDMPRSGHSFFNQSFKETILLWPTILNKIIKEYTKRKSIVLIGHSLGAWPIHAYEEKVCTKVYINPFGFTTELTAKSAILSRPMCASFLKRLIFRGNSGILRFFKDPLHNKKGFDSDLEFYLSEVLRYNDIDHPIDAIRALFDYTSINPRFISLLSDTDRLSELFFLSRRDPLIHFSSLSAILSKNKKDHIYIDPMSGHCLPIENPEFIIAALSNYIKENI